MSTVIYAPTPLPSEIAAPVVFLAGSIDLGLAPDWQAEMTEALQDTDALLLNPRRPKWDQNILASPNDPAFREQVEWELDGLERADIVAVYFAPGSASPISLLELGLFARSGKLIAGCNDGFSRFGNVSIVCERLRVPVLPSLAELISSVRIKIVS